MSSPDPPAPPLEEAHFRRLLVAVDGSGNAELALAAALTATRRDNGLLTLIGVAAHVMHSTSLGATGISAERLQQQADDEAQRALRDAVRRLPDDVSATTLFRQGKPGPEIVAEARTGRYDAVVLGARGLGRIGALLGSVSQYVLHHAEIPVIVVHAPRDVDRGRHADAGG
jgi:nucleotide-binding universal stress UspA family protein